jgi:hypothetical protein
MDASDMIEAGAAEARGAQIPHIIVTRPSQASLQASLLPLAPPATQTANQHGNGYHHGFQHGFRRQILRASLSALRWLRELGVKGLMVVIGALSIFVVMLINIVQTIVKALAGRNS